MRVVLQRSRFEAMIAHCAGCFLMMAIVINATGCGSSQLTDSSGTCPDGVTITLSGTVSADWLAIPVAKGDRIVVSATYDQSAPVTSSTTGNNRFADAVKSLTVSFPDRGLRWRFGPKSGANLSSGGSAGFWLESYGPIEGGALADGAAPTALGFAVWGAYVFPSTSVLPRPEEVSLDSLYWGSYSFGIAGGLGTGYFENVTREAPLPCL